MSPSLPVAWVAPNPSTDSEMRLQVHSGLRLRLYLPRGRWLSELQACTGHSWGLCLLRGLSCSTPHSLQGASLFTMG